MSAILFGSISTLADTSELQRQAFNDAFEAFALDWQWSREDYRSMLTSSGGANRIEEYAASRGQDVDAAAVHAKKSQLFQDLLRTADVSPRPGVVETVEEAKRGQHKVGFVTTTSQGNIDALLSALRPHISAEMFDLIVDSDSVSSPKPDPAAYEFALERLGEDTTSVVAIEDNLGGVKAAKAAGITCIAFPNANTAGGDFSTAAETVDSLDAGRVVGIATS
ncbi:phosphatase [Mycobacterium antarcticum]|uniref:HAD family hydrolase n=1 Tax=unclassified Mycolicibacterium TaxID=2636767 RepID=UPI0023919889|nr:MULTISPECIES: HAD-IA family hydrolase [unclassified Mycolicibacterium]GLP78173.1 phosphatase [Mycolicibacterium sp. TUM20983]GLP81224.1 phosphatase [Mycolicibacterium sp. TUM20984]